jgi:hypothetical protein
MLLRNLIDSKNVFLNVEQFILVKYMAILLKIFILCCPQMVLLLYYVLLTKDI